DDLFTNMIQVGESGGVLDVVLQRLSGYIEKAAALKRKVKSAMVYPLTIISVAILVIIFMMTFVIPTFASMFRNMGAELPLPTKIVLAISDFTRQYVLFIVAALVGFVIAFKKYYSTDQGSQVIDALMLKVPIVGMLVQKVAVARFTRTLGTLISSGVPILEGLRITARSAGNPVVEKAFAAARAAVPAGRTLAEPLRASPVFPPMVVHMISVGENTGALDQMLGKIADFYDDEVDAAVSALTSLLEPLMIVFLGVIVGGLVVAMYLPIFRMVTLIKYALWRPNRGTTPRDGVRRQSPAPSLCLGTPRHRRGVADHGAAPAQRSRAGHERRHPRSTALRRRGDVGRPAAAASADPAPESCVAPVSPRRRAGDGRGGRHRRATVDLRLPLRALGHCRLRAAAARGGLGYGGGW